MHSRALTLCPDSPDSCVITQLPYVEMFENDVSNFLPCWYRMNNDSSYCFSNIYINHFYNYSELLIQGSYTPTAQYVVLPTIDSALLADNTLYLLIQFSSYISYYNNAHELGTMSDPNDPNTFTRICTLPRAYNGFIGDTAIQLNTLGPNDHIALKTNITPNSDNDYLRVNRIEIDRMPECGIVHNPTVLKKGHCGAHLGWEYTPADESDSTHFIVRVYRNSDSALVSAETTYQQQALIDSLEPNTIYIAHISALCGGVTDTLETLVGFQTLSFSSCFQPLVVAKEWGGDSITITWIPTIGDTAWYIYIQNGSRWDTLERDYRQRTYTLRNLQPGTTYKLRVNSLCNISQSIDANTVTVTTLCRAEDVPFYESFDYFIPNCWRNPQSYQSIDGRIAMRLQYLWYTGLPLFSEPLNNLYISGKLLRSNLVIGVLPDWGTLPNDLYPIDTVVNDFDTCWESFYVDLSNSPYSSGQVILTSLNSSTTRPIFLDDLTVGINPGCPQPSHLHDSAITASSAFIRWRANGNVWSYEVEYGPHGFEHGTGSTLLVTAASVTLAGLRSGTNYDVYIRSHCLSGDTSEWSFPVTFTTLCSSIYELPWTEDFSMWEPGHTYATSQPACWNSYSTYISNYGITYTILPSGDTTKVLSLGNVLNQSRIYLPRVSRYIRIQSLLATMTAWYKNGSDLSWMDAGNPPQLVVGVSKDVSTTTTFVPVDTLTITPVPTTYDVVFNSYTDTGHYITLLLSGNGHQNLYLNDITLDMPPDCIRPTHLCVDSVTATQATLRWREQGNASDWQIEFGPQGFLPGTGTSIVTDSNFLALTGLSPNTRYEFRVRSLCNGSSSIGWSDTSEWSHQRFAFSTIPNPAQLPYYCNFEDSTESNLWTSFSNGNFAWRWGIVDSADNSLGYNFAISGDTIITQITANSILYRDFDFGTLDTSSPDASQRYTLTYKYKVDQSFYHGFSHSGSRAVLCLTDPQQPLSVSNTFLMSPWGHVDSLQKLSDSIIYDEWSFDTVQIDTFFIADTFYTIIRTGWVNHAQYGNWETDTIDLPSLYGIHRLAFYLSSEIQYDDTLLRLSVDDINIFPTPCPVPDNLRVSDIAIDSANLSWSGMPNARYMVTYHCSELPDPLPDQLLTDTAETNHITLSGLSSFTSYTVYVQQICDSGGLSGLSDPLQFTTLLCNDIRSDSVAVGPITSSRSSLMPVAFANRYSYSQQIIPATWLNGAGVINAVNLSYILTENDDDVNNYSLYLGHTDSLSFTNNTFLDPSRLSLVYAGPLPKSGGWAKIVLQAPFVYNGSSNLVLAITNNGSTAKATAFNVVSTSYPSSILLRSDSPFNTTSHLSLQQSAGIRSQHSLHCQAIFDYCPACTCASPELLPPILYMRHCILRWRDTHADAYQLSYRTIDSPQWDTSFITTDTSFHVFDIEPERDYVYRLRQLCADSSLHNWSYGLFHTSSTQCPSPQHLILADLTPEGATLSWNHDDDFLVYYLHVFNSVFDTLITTPDTQFTVQHLYYGFTYKAAVQAQCYPSMPPGAWSDTISFTTPTCPDATNLTYTNLRSNSVDLDWHSEDTISLWEISYGAPGFQNNQGTNVLADHHPFTLTGLESETEYELILRSICGSGFPSEHWSNHIIFTTAPAGIDDRPSAHGFTVRPNPARERLTVALGEAIEGPVRLTLRDAQGRTVHQSTLAPGTRSKTITINSDALSTPPGIYFATISTTTFSATRKFIVE